MKKEQGIILPIIMVALVVVLLGAAGYFAYKQYSAPKEQPEQITCTEEAKVCPDGSTVGRTGPNCEFAECPVVPDQTAGWKTYTNTQYGYEIKYPAEYSPFEFNNTIHFPKSNDEINWGITISTGTLQLKETCNSEEYAAGIIMAGDSTSKQVFLSGISKNVSQLRNVYGTFTPTILTYIPTQDCLTSKKMIVIYGSENLLTQYNQLLSTFKFTPVK